MKSKDLRQLTLNELEQKEADFTKELFDLRFQRTAGKLEKPSQMRKITKTIARIKTIKKEMKS